MRRQVEYLHNDEIADSPSQPKAEHNRMHFRRKKGPRIYFEHKSRYNLEYIHEAQKSLI